MKYRTSKIYLLSILLNENKIYLSDIRYKQMNNKSINQTWSQIDCTWLKLSKTVKETELFPFWYSILLKVLHSTSVYPVMNRLLFNTFNSRLKIWRLALVIKWIFSFVIKISENGFQNFRKFLLRYKKVIYI